MSHFRDHFSGHARQYARARPRYPGELYAWLASLVEERDLAWDCATGNGQAASGLAKHFRRVVAADASVDQIKHAGTHDNVDYVVALASQSGLPADRVRLITVAQAMHWFDLEPFYREARRVLAPGGVLAAWTYGLFRSAGPLDAVIDRFANDVVGPFWPRERQHVDSGYSDLPFPFEPIEAPEFVMRVTWRLEDLVDYLETWSAVRRYWSARGFSPVADLEHELRQVWGPEESRHELRWRLTLRVGRGVGS